MPYFPKSPEEPFFCSSIYDQREAGMKKRIKDAFFRNPFIPCLSTIVVEERAVLSFLFCPVNQRKENRLDVFTLGNSNIGANGINVSLNGLSLHFLFSP